MLERPNSPHLALAAALAAVVSLWACSDPGDAPADPTLTRFDTWELEEVGRIGSVDDPEQSLTRLSQILIGPEEELYIAQRSENTIRVFDSDNALLTSIGRRGEGPGDFGRLGSMGFRGDTLYVGDNTLGRVTFFTRQGEVLSSLRWVTGPLSAPPGAGGFSASAPQVLLNDGSALLTPPRIVGMPVPLPEEATVEDTTAVLYLRTYRDQPRLDTILLDTGRALRHTIPAAGRAFSFGCPWDDDPIRRLMGDGSGVIEVDRTPATTDSTSAFQVSLIGPDGDRVFEMPIRYTPRALTQPEVDSYLEEMRAASTTPDWSPPSPAAIEAKLREHGCIPSHYVPVTAAVTTQDGSIWLKREAIPGDSTEWSVLDRNGAPRGSVRIPTRQTVLASVADLVVVAETDEFDVPYVVKYRILARG